MISGLSPKVSLSRISQLHQQRNYLNNHPSHISYEAPPHDIFVLQPQSRRTSSPSTPNTTKHRRNIFPKNKLEDHQLGTAKFIDIITDQNVEGENQHKLLKNSNIACSPKTAIVTKLKLINEEIEQCRRQKFMRLQNKTTFMNPSKNQPRKPEIRDCNLQKLRAIEDKTRQNYELLRSQQLVLTKKIPALQSKISEGGKRVKELRDEMQRKEDRNAESQHRLFQAIKQRQMHLLKKDNEISRVENQLSYIREENCLKNYEAEISVLEVERLRRIQDLQANNLKLYQSLHKNQQRKQYEQRSYYLSEFVDLKEESYEEASEWMDSYKPSKMSTIGDMEEGSSRNNTMAQILSPLSLIDQAE